MTFDEFLTQVCEMLRRQGRLSYRTLKRRFNLDADDLEDLMAELIEAQHVAVDEDGKVTWSWSDIKTLASPGAPRDT